MPITELTAFLGWAAVLNIALLCLTSLVFYLANPLVVKVHKWFTPLSDEDLQRSYFAYLAAWKLLVLFFLIIPYFSLKIAF